ncbi:ParB/RepB/Spo0J family partition protein [Aminobacter carboxidus]|uniref:ParB N-terminal domain-containing protein n=1 Tax=Aminobacter carboxidus TaxID=376165 RepID=A0ABR9GWT1_9HYPH|nr:ParB/Srx family N-terminal domain-containing protein [Aminobacter carboxidus]MBE1208134.1 ParB N-terminal domain-containing protein [Aminobacter carboxidus]
MTGTISMTVDLVDLMPDDAINARRTRNDEGIDELKASIRAHGVAQSLRVRRGDDGKYKIIAGSRRHRVLCELAVDGDSAAGVPVDDCFQVPVLIGEDDDTTAREISQAENFIRLPQHEADTYETFRELADRGLDEGQIASRFGIDPKRVKRMLALGRLSPVILDAWRSGIFNERGSGVETVRAFTLAPSIAEQERVFNKLTKDRNLHSHAVMRAFGGADDDIKKWVKIAGLDAYKAAGGAVTTDLFGDDHIVADKALMHRVAEESIKAKLDGLKAEGWSWVSTNSDLGYYWEHSWKREKPGDGQATADEKKLIKKLEKAVAKGTDGTAGELARLQTAIAGRQWTPDQLAKAGSVVKIGYHGDVEIVRGVVKPQAEKKASSASDEPKEKGPPTISNALHQRLSAQATLAVRQALQQEPRVGLVALLAGFITHRHLHTDSPVRVYHEGFAKVRGEDKETFASVFSRLSVMSDQELFQVAAGCAGDAVHMERPHNGKLPFDSNAAPLAASIQPDLLTTALRATFDAPDYFGGASKPFVIEAIREAINDDEARKAEKLKKAELVEFALANVPQTGWLPPELRAPTYSGPGKRPAIVAPTLDDDPDFAEITEEEVA